MLNHSTRFFIFTEILGYMVKNEEVKILLNSVGIDCNIINSNNLNHVWNIVKIDGEYYQLDVTWYLMQYLKK